MRELVARAVVRLFIKFPYKNITCIYEKPVTQYSRINAWK